MQPECRLPCPGTFNGEFARRLSLRRSFYAHSAESNSLRDVVGPIGFPVNEEAANGFGHQFSLENLESPPLHSKVQVVLILRTGGGRQFGILRF
jgi:hypothetical protein